jgi:Zn-dependent protease with chaperone function
VTDASSEPSPVEPEGVGADYFDGRTARAHPVRVHVAGDRLVIAGTDVRRSEPLTSVHWPERTRHGVRMLHLADGASVHCRDSLAWDTWSADRAGRRDSMVVRVQQRWKWVMVSTLVLLAFMFVSYRHLLPLAARGVVALIPASADQALGDSALQSIDENGLMKPTTLSLAQQQAVAQAFARSVARLPPGDVPAYDLEFRQSTIGPNAFALPGGTIVLTDELYKVVDGDSDILVGVLGHELGHLRHRHGMRMLVQAGVLSAAAGALYGDFSTLFSQIPVLLGQASYSRAFEHEADVDSVRLMRASGISPAVMARFFVKVRQPAKGAQAASAASAPSLPRLPIALASHPADEERIRFFEDAAREH